MDNFNGQHKLKGLAPIKKIQKYTFGPLAIFKTYGATTFNIKGHNITTFSITTPSTMTLNVERCYAEDLYTECRYAQRRCIVCHYAKCYRTRRTGQGSVDAISPPHNFMVWGSVLGLLEKIRKGWTGVSYNKFYWSNFMW